MPSPVSLLGSPFYRLGDRGPGRPQITLGARWREPWYLFGGTGAGAQPGWVGNWVASPPFQTTTPRRHRMPTAHATSQRQRARAAWLDGPADCWLRSDPGPGSGSAVSGATVADLARGGFAVCASSLHRCARLGAAIYHMEQGGGGESRSKQVTCGGETQMGTPGLQL